MRFEGNVLVINVKEGGHAQFSMLPQSSSRCCREITIDNNNNQLPYRLRRRERTSLMWLPALEPEERCVKYASSILGLHRGSNE